jgi:hypothetical protein
MIDLTFKLINLKINEKGQALPVIAEAIVALGG